MSLRKRIHNIKPLKHLTITTDEDKLYKILTQDGIIDTIKKVGAKIAIEKDKLLGGVEDKDSSAYKHTSKHWIKLPGISKKETSWSMALWPADNEAHTLNKLAQYYIIHTGMLNSNVEDKERYNAIESVIEANGHNTTQGLLRLAKDIEETKDIILSYFSGSKAETYLQECEEYTLEYVPVKTLSNLFEKEVSLKYAAGYRYIPSRLIAFSLDELILYSRYRGKADIEACIKENLAKPLKELEETFSNYQQYIFKHINTVEKENEDATPAVQPEQTE